MSAIEECLERRARELDEADASAAAGRLDKLERQVRVLYRHMQRTA